MGGTHQIKEAVRFSGRQRKPRGSRRGLMDDLATPAWSRPAVARKTAYQRVLVVDDEQMSDDAEVAKQENADGEEVVEEEEGEEEEDDNVVQEVDEGAATTTLDVGVLIEAMSKCVAFYHQTNKVEFYAMVAEEYGTLAPDCEEVSVDAIEQMELRLQRYAVGLTRGRSDDALPQDVAPHVAPLARFYNTLGVTDVRRKDPGDRQVVTGGEEGRPSDSPLKSPGGQTDGSISNPATPQENRGEETTGIAAENDSTTHDELPVQAPPSTSTALTEATTTSTSLTNPRSPQFSYNHATSTIAGLTKIHVESKQRLRDAEDLLKAEKDRLQQVKSEYKELKVIVKQYRQRDEERKRLHQLLSGDDDGRDSDDSGSGDDAPRLRVRELRKMLRKETKRARRLQENLSLKFQLLQSENQRHHMKIEQQMAELRNEYTDSFVFGP